MAIQIASFMFGTDNAAAVVDNVVAGAVTLAHTTTDDDGAVPVGETARVIDPGQITFTWNVNVLYRGEAGDASELLASRADGAWLIGTSGQHGWAQQVRNPGLQVRFPQPGRVALQGALRGTGPLYYSPWALRRTYGPDGAETPGLPVQRPGNRVNAIDLAWPQGAVGANGIPTGGFAIGGIAGAASETEHWGITDATGAIGSQSRDYENGIAVITAGVPASPGGDVAPVAGAGITGGTGKLGDDDFAPASFAPAGGGTIVQWLLLNALINEIPQE